MKTLEYRTVDNTIEVWVSGALWAVWPINDTTTAIADGRLSEPADLNNAIRD